MGFRAQGVGYFDGLVAQKATVSSQALPKIVSSGSAEDKNSMEPVQQLWGTTENRMECKCELNKASLAFTHISEPF